MILAIDFGSTSIKAGVFDRKLRQFSAGSVPLKYQFGAGGRVELDVAGVEQAVRRVCVRKVEAIVLTSQAQTHTVLDRHGRVKRPFVSWQDQRAQSACKPLQKSLEDFPAHSSFADLLPALQICQLKCNPVERGDIVVSLPSHFVRLWTGENVIDDNLAAMCGLYSLLLGDWWPAALRACGLRREQLSRIVPIGSVAAYTTTAARKFGLSAGIPVVLAGNDQTAGAYAARLEAGNGVLLTLGSAQVVYALLERMPDPRRGSIRGPYPGNRAYLMAADAAGGNVVNWAKAILANCQTDSQFFKQAARAQAACGGLRFELSDYGDMAAWQNIATHHSVADFARSVIECLGKRMLDLVNRLGLSLADHQVLVAGGGSEQPLWVRTVSEKLGVCLKPVQTRPALGAARMAVARLNA